MADKAPKSPPTKASPPKTLPRAPTTSIRPPKAPPAAERTADRPVVLAVITGAHGVTGEVRLKLFTDDLTPYRTFNGGALTLKSLRNGIARFAEIPDRNAAERLRGTELTVPRSALPPLEEGEYYHADLLGLSCVSTKGESLGTVVAIDNFGAGDVIEIERPDGKRFMVPMRTEAVPEWDAERLVVDEAFVS
jgi:16S rRNA processing protein RimM